MKHTAPTEKKLDELTLKEALIMDRETLKLRRDAMVDPCPLPFIPLTVFVVGAKLKRGASKLIDSFK